MVVNTFALAVYLLVGQSLEYQVLKSGLSEMECHIMGAKVQTISMESQDPIHHGQLVCIEERSI